MRVFLTGATGFIGRALALRLVGAGHEVIAWVRDPHHAAAILGSDISLVAPRDSADIGTALAGADAIVNLAGEPVVGTRWTPDRKRAIVESRLNLTRAIVAAIATSPRPPAVFVSASAVGYYGDLGAEIVADEAPCGNDFLAAVCSDWEAAALEAQASKVRVVVPRIGIVLGAEGGALAKMIVPFRLGFGGPIGSGRQFVPWIHIDDLVEMIATAFGDQRYSGPMIAAAPNPVSNRDLATAIGKTLHRPSLTPVPPVALKLMLGESATLLLTGQRVDPLRLKRAGFSWRFPTIESALADILVDNNPEIRPISNDSLPPSEYLKRRPPSFFLTQRTTINAPREDVFRFFSRPQNLGVMTPPSMQFQITSALPDEIRRDLVIEYKLRLGPIPIRWRTRIEEVRPPDFFSDSQESGPYGSWWHEHHFHADGSATQMEDRVYYSAPVGMISNPLLVAPALKRIFAYRAQIIRLRWPPEKLI